MKEKKINIDALKYILDRLEIENKNIYLGIDLYKRYFRKRSKDNNSCV
mgnify:CR=1 FL=1